MKIRTFWRSNVCDANLFARLFFIVPVAMCVESSICVMGQSQSSSVALRNVRIEDEKDERVTVLISEGKLKRISDDSLIPLGAVVIDGGGSFLAVGADGTYKLTSSLSSPSSSTKLVKTSNASYPKVSKASTDPRDLKDSPDSPQQQQVHDSLASQVTDPSAPLSTITFTNKYIPSHWRVDDDENELNIQAAIPYKFGGKPNIFRVTAPFVTNSPAPGARNGIGDVGLLNITILHQKWGNLAIGPVASFGTNKGPGVDTFSIGPAIGAVLKKERWVYGVFNQNLFSFGGDIAVTNLQPILAYTLNSKVSFAIGDAQFTFDWKRGGKLVNAPASGQVNYIHMFGKQPVRFFINAQYNFINDFGARKWTLSPGFALILR